MAADDDADVFEITDFTTASDWERFIARLEEILHEWKLVRRLPIPPAQKGEYTNGVWAERSEELSFADFRFTITHIFLKSHAADWQNKEEKETRDDVEEEEKEDAYPTVFTDLMNMDNDFPSKAHCLCRWFGVQELITIVPACTSDVIDNESRVKLLLSSVSIALNNAGCPVPVFVNVHQHWRKLYSGTAVLPGASIEFEMVFFNKVPQQYNHLAGLLDMFKAKLGPTVSPRPPVSVSVRFTYILSEWVNSPWPQLPPDFSSPSGGEVGYTDFNTLPFGAWEDPVSELQLSCTWPSLSEDMIVENHVYSDLDPLQAPQWSVRIQMTDDPQCLLGEILMGFLQLCHRKETTDELLGGMFFDEVDKDSNVDISHALHRLTEPAMVYNIPSLTKAVSSASTRLKIRPEEAPISEELLNQILVFLFPDAKDQISQEQPDDEIKDEEKDTDSIATDTLPTTPAESDDDNSPSQEERLKELSKQLKTSSLDSVVHKLAVCICSINHTHSLRAVAHLWQEFVLEMRYRWENKYTIPGVDDGPPNMGTCILHQKLQMLNCCIERKIKREHMHKGYTGERESPLSTPRDQVDSSNSCQEIAEGDEYEDRGQGQAAEDQEAAFNDGTKVKNAGGQDSSSEDEFYECDEQENQSVAMETEEIAAVGSGDHGEAEQAGTHGTTADEGNRLEESMDSVSVASETSYKETYSHKPEGRLATCGSLKLMNSGELMYIPVTQEPAPMTEDMLEEHAEVLARLGTSAEGAQLRARMQSACLLSDMESFKAANPGCALEDFVRWYSPRDWVEEEIDENGQIVVKAHMSLRMQIPGNMWAEVWQSARPVPARRQKRLFDDTKEAEKVLHFLSSMNPAEVVLHLMPMLAHAAIVKIMENDDKDLPQLKTLMDQVILKAVRVTRSPQQHARKYEDLFRMIVLAETVIARGKSLKNKFTEDLLEQKGAEEELQHFVSGLLQLPEVALRGGPCGPAGAIIHKLFVAAQKASYMVIEEDDDQIPTDKPSTVPDFPRPSGREYILRTMVPRPAPYSKNLPQRLYCVLVDNEFRLAGAFSSDTTFQ